MIPSLPFHPNSILDIGANVGHWANEAAQKWPQAYLMLVEGNPECAQALANTGRSHRTHRYVNEYVVPTIKKHL